MSDAIESQDDSLDQHEKTVGDAFFFLLNKIGPINADVDWDAVPAEGVAPSQMTAEQWDDLIKTVEEHCVPLEMRHAPKGAKWRYGEPL